jgi:hypothetical protein
MRPNLRYYCGIHCETMRRKQQKNLLGGQFKKECKQGTLRFITETRTAYNWTPENHDARFEVFMVVKIQIKVFWVEMPYSVMVGY